MHHSVHPHLCGAYVVGMDAPPVVGGSSPPTWGIHRVRGQERAERRFIPTYVGHTLSPSRIPRAIPVHPHLRGAYVPAGVLTSGLCGSSPPTWGIRFISQTLTKSARFIPTYVGHTEQAVFPELLQPVHPHLRGAYGATRQPFDCPIGSSPPTWGIRAQSRNPATNPGSSPPTWGIRRRLGFFTRRVRFIPTYVGHTWPGYPPSGISTVHPHLRGAYFCRAV